jgi:hypothetical protein
MSVLTACGSMAKKQVGEMTRIASEALELARIAASYRKISLMSYLSEVIKTSAERDIEEGHRQLGQSKSKK